MQYCFGCYNLFTHSLKCKSQYSFRAKGVMYSILPNTDVAANSIFLWVSSPGAIGWSKTKGLFAFEVTATFCFHASISPWVIAFLLLLLARGWPFLLKWVTWGRQSRIGQRICERRGACEPAVEDEEAGAIAEDERSEDCLINYLWRGRKASLIYMRGAFYRGWFQTNCKRI